MNERPKSREETPKEGGDTAWSAIPRCNNMSLRRTNIKALARMLSGIFETVMQFRHQRTRLSSPADHGPKSLDS